MTGRRAQFLTPVVALGLALCAMEVAPMPTLDKGVWRRKEWGGVFNSDEKKVSSVSNAIVGHGLAQPYVLPCETDGKSHDGFECWRVYLVVDRAYVEAVYAIYGNEYSELSLSTEDTTNFFQAPVGIGVDVGGVAYALFDYVPSARFDSFFTLGADDGMQSSLLSLVGFPKFGNTSSIETANGAVYAADPTKTPKTTVIPKELQARAADVELIAQFTVEKDTIFNFVFNVQGKATSAVDVNTWQEAGLCATNAKEPTFCAAFPKPNFPQTTFSRHDEL